MTHPEDEPLFNVLSKALGDYNPPTPWGWAETEPLNADTIRAAIEKVKADPVYRLCPPNDFHIFHPLDYQAGGYQRCGNCGGFYDLGERP